MADPLNRRLTLCWKLTRRQVRITRQELLHGALKSVEAGRINAIREIYPYRTYGSFITDSETHRVHHIVEVIEVPLVKAERDIFDAGVNVSGIVEQNAADILANQRKAQFDIADEDGVAAERESSGLGSGTSWAGGRSGVSRTGLVFGKGT